MTITINGVKLSDMTVSYLETALWSSTACLPCDDHPEVAELVDMWNCDEDHELHGIADGDPLDDWFDISDFDEESLKTAESEVSDFVDYLESLGLLEPAQDFAGGDERIGHDFWLTRNGHGAGFWDGDYDDHQNPERSIGRKLTDAAKCWGGCDIMIDCDGKLSIS